MVFNLASWTKKLTLAVLNNGDMKKGVYDLELEREWFKKDSPYLKFLTGMLGMVLPVASSSVKLALDETAKIGDFLGTADSTSLSQAHGVAPSALTAPPCADSTPCSKPKALVSAVSSL
jgi:hypothetical protein